MQLSKLKEWIPIKEIFSIDIIKQSFYVQSRKVDKITLDAKKGSSVTVDCTNEHSITSGTPLSPFKQASAKMAPA
jgi:hypothetical protein